MLTELYAICNALCSAFNQITNILGSKEENGKLKDIQHYFFFLIKAME